MMVNKGDTSKQRSRLKPQAAADTMWLWTILADNVIANTTREMQGIVNKQREV